MLLIRLAVRNLTRRRTRTILTILGVGIAIAFTVTILSLSEGLMVSFENSIAKQGADIVIVPKEAEAYPYPDVAAFVGSFPEELLKESPALAFRYIRPDYAVSVNVSEIQPINLSGAEFQELSKHS